MKTEFLKELGIAEEVISKIMAENGKDIEATKNKFADYEDVKKQLKTADETINGYKNMDIDGIKRSATEWETKAKQAEIDAAKKISDMQFNHALNGALTGAKAKNVKAVSALLNMEGLKHDGESIIGLKEQLESIKKDNAYLFEDDTPPVKFTGATNTNVATATTDKKSNEANAAIRSFLRKD